MVTLAFDAGNPDDQRHFLVLYVSVGTGGMGKPRTPDVQDREISVLQKLRAISVPDPQAPEGLPWDALQPRVLTSGDLLLEPGEQAICLEYVKEARWPAHLSEVRRAVQRRLTSGDNV